MDLSTVYMGRMLEQGPNLLRRQFTSLLPRRHYLGEFGKLAQISISLLLNLALIWSAIPVSITSINLVNILHSRRNFSKWTEALPIQVLVVANVNEELTGSPVLS